MKKKTISESNFRSKIVMLGIFCLAWSMSPLYMWAMPRQSRAPVDAGYAFIQTIQNEDANTLDTAVQTLPGEQLVIKYQVINTGDVELAWTGLTDSLSGDLADACGLPSIITVGGTLSCTTQIFAANVPEGQSNLATANVPIVGTARDIAWYQTQELGTAIGDLVWADRNANGIQDVAEPGLPGIIVTLLDGIGQTLQETTTNSTGRYLFTDLTPGTIYRVQFGLPNVDAVFTLKNRDTANEQDSDANPVSGRSDLIMLAEGEYNATVDAGMTGRIANKPASLGDWVWVDDNGDGIQDINEVGVADVQVELLDSSGQVIDQQMTGESGHYLFTELIAGRYFVRFTPPPGYTFSQNHQTANSNLDSNVAELERTTADDSAKNMLHGLTDAVDLDVGTNARGWDAGLIPPVHAADTSLFNTFLPLIWAE